MGHFLPLVPFFAKEIGENTPYQKGPQQTLYQKEDFYEKNPSQPPGPSWFVF